jgi:hypothetical protein
MMKQAIVLAVLAACGSSMSPGGDDDGDDDAGNNGSGKDQPDFTSGTRIKFNVLSTPDGAKVSAGAHDTALGVDCTFALAGDGVTRCLPNGPFYVMNTYFADDDCTVPVASGSSCDTPAYIRGIPSAAACPAGGSRVFAVGAKHAQAYYKAGVQCTLLPSTAGTAYYVVGAEIAATDFQSATVALE